MSAAGRGNWSPGKCVCSVEQLPWNVADAVIKPGERRSLNRRTCAGKESRLVLFKSGTRGL